MTNVEPDSLAAEEGLRPGDIIKSVDGDEVKSVEDFDKFLKKKGIGSGIRLLVESRGIDRFVFLRQKK